MQPETGIREHLSAIDELIALEERNVEGTLDAPSRERWQHLNGLLFGAERQDRRQFFRVEAHRPTRIEGAAGSIAAEATSISVGGLFLVTDTAQPEMIGRHLDVVLPLPSVAEERIVLRVEVCRVVPAGSGSASGLGVRFLELSADHRKVLLGYMRAQLVWLAELSREMYQFFFQHSADIAMLLTIDGLVREINEAGAELLGRSPAALADKSLADLVVREQVDEARSALDRVRHDGRVLLTLAFPSANGELVPVEARLSVLQVGGLRYGTMLVGQDRRLRQLLEEQGRVLERRLFQSDKLATLGQITASIAHDINNPLGYLLTNLTILKEQVGPLVALVRAARARGEPVPVPGGDLQRIEEDLEQVVGDCLEGSNRIRELVHDLRDFSRVDGSAEGTIDVAQCLEASLRVTRNLLRHRAQVQRSDAADLPPAHGNFGRLSQVFLNLLTNAAQSFERSDLERNVVQITTRHHDGAVEIAIRDNGRGIPADSIERLFEPFFTTRRAEGGTGLGLAIAKENTEALGGTLTVTSTLGEGSQFTVRLPVSRTESPSMLPPAPISRPARRLSILIVDDDRFLLRGLKRALDRQFAVTTAESPKAALELLDSQPFDAVLCDVMMPEMGGLDFLETLGQTQPALANRVVLMTGGVFSADEEQRLARLANVVLRKPAGIVEVVDALVKVSGL